MESTHSQKLIVVAFSSLLTQPVDLLPPIVASNLPVMFRQMILELTLIEDEAEKEAARIEDDVYEDEDDEIADDDDDEDDDDEDDGEDDNEDNHGRNGSRVKAQIPEDGYEDHEDCPNAEDVEYMATLLELSKEEGMRYIDGDPVDDEDECPEVVSFLDQADVLGLFLSAMNDVGRLNPSLMASLQSTCPAEDSAKLADLIAKHAVKQADVNQK